MVIPSLAKRSSSHGFMGKFELMNVATFELVGVFHVVGRW